MARLTQSVLLRSRIIGLRSSLALTRAVRPSSPPPRAVELAGHHASFGFDDLPQHHPNLHHALNEEHARRSHLEPAVLRHGLGYKIQVICLSMENEPNHHRGARMANLKGRRKEVNERNRIRLVL